MERRIHTIFVISGVDYSLEFIWLAKYIDKNRFIIEFVWLNKSEPAMNMEMKKIGIPSRYIHSPSKFHYPLVFFKLLKHFIKNRPEIVHAHIFEASLISMPAAWFAGVQNRIFTRHNSTYHAKYFPHLVKYDRMMCRIASHVISISPVVSKVLLENERLKPEKLRTIQHGFDFQPFQEVPTENIESLRHKYKLSKKNVPVIGVISRFIELKGIQYIIPAFIELMKSYPDAHLILANSSGNYGTELEKLYSAIPESNITIIPFEKDLFALYKLFDIFVHVPIEPDAEAYGQIYIEALASGLPCIFTLSGIAHECIKDRENALIVPYKNSTSIHDSMLMILNEPDLRNILKNNARKIIEGKYGIKEVTVQLENLYEEITTF